jgi:DUF4097 and DUF4098 domain-containing protein YvlB
MTISAPSHLKLHIWSVDGQVGLKSWNSEVRVRTNNGLVKLENVRGAEVSITCANCPVNLKNINASVHAAGGGGAIDVSHMTGKKIYLETTSGALKAGNVKGQQLYITTSGTIDGQNLDGKIEFRADKSTVTFRDIVGFLSGTLNTGNISAVVREWKFFDKGLIETNQGNIHLTLPRSFSGDLDIWSPNGKADLDFPWVTAQTPQQGAQMTPNHIVGRVKNGGELLKIFSASGDILVSKGKF